MLPTVRVAIFDEAHQLNETGVQFLGRQLGTGQLIDFTRDLLPAGLQFVSSDGTTAGYALVEATPERLTFTERGIVGPALTDTITITR